MDRSYNESLTKGERFGGGFGSREGAYYPWIDTMRGICMIAILIFHTEVYYAGDIITPYQCYVHNALAGFFFISGYLFLGDKGFSLAHKIKYIARSLVLPYFIFTIILGVLKILFQNADAAVVLSKIILGQASWFVAALIVAELLMCITMFITRGKTVFLCLVAVLSFAIAFVFGNKHDPSPHYYQQNLWYFNDAMLALGIIICGTLYRRFESFFNRFHPILYTSSLFFLIIIIKIMIMTRHEDTVIGSVEVSNIPLFLADITVSTLFLVALCKWLGRVFMISWTGEHSLVYYFFCGASPTLVALLLNKIGFPYGSYWQLIIALVLVYDLCTIISFIVYRYLPFLTGKRKTKAAALLFIFILVPNKAISQTFSEMKATANEHSLPLINLTVDINNLRNTYFINGEIEIFDPQETYSDTHHCLLRYRGASSLTNEKKSFAVKLIDENGNDFDSNIFGIRNENSWILDAMASDKMRMRNVVCFKLWNEISKTPYETNFNRRNGIVGTHVEVFLNGQYHGLYCLSDKVDRKLLSLKKYSSDTSGNITPRGLLYKCVSWSGGSNLEYYNDESTDNASWNAWELKYPEDYPSSETWQPLIDFIDFCSTKTTDQDFLDNYNEYFYVDNFTDYLLFVYALGITDNTYKNSYLSVVNINNGHKMLLTPWDMDSSLGRLYNGNEYKKLFDVDNIKKYSPLKRLFKYDKDNITDKVYNRWQELSATTFHPTHLKETIHNYAASIEKSGAWQRERDKWNGNPVELSANIYEEEDYIMEWYAQNYEFIDNKIGHNTTSITHYQTPNTNQPTPNTYHPTPIFDLSGRRIIPNRPGIYIKDNRKYILPRK